LRNSQCSLALPLTYFTFYFRYLISLLNGVRGLFPCVRCLVPTNEQNQLIPYALRTAKNSEKQYKKALQIRENRSKTAAMLFLKERSSLRMIKVRYLLSLYNESNAESECILGCQNGFTQGAICGRTSRL
jgi:hypothetical protein